MEHPGTSSLCTDHSGVMERSTQLFWWYIHTSWSNKNENVTCSPSHTMEKICTTWCFVKTHTKSGTTDDKIQCLICSVLTKDKIKCSKEHQKMYNK